MDSNARKQLNRIVDALKKNNSNSKEKTLIDENIITNIDIKPGERSGVFVAKKIVLEILNKSSNNYFHVETGKNRSEIVVFILK